MKVKALSRRRLKVKKAEWLVSSSVDLLASSPGPEDLMTVYRAVRRLERNGYEDLAELLFDFLEAACEESGLVVIDVNGFLQVWPLVDFPVCPHGMLGVPDGLELSLVDFFGGLSDGRF